MSLTLSPSFSTPMTYSYSSSSVFSPAALFSATSNCLKSGYLCKFLKNYLDLGTDPSLSYDSLPATDLRMPGLCLRHGPCRAQPQNASQPAFLRSHLYFDACYNVMMLLLLSLLPGSSLVLWKNIKGHWDTGTLCWSPVLRSQSNSLSEKHARKQIR